MSCTRCTLSVSCVFLQCNEQEVSHLISLTQTVHRTPPLHSLQKAAVIVLKHRGELQQWRTFRLHLVLATIKVHVIAQQPHDLLGPSGSSAWIGDQPNIVLPHGQFENLLAHVTELLRHDHLAGMYLHENVMLVKQLGQRIAVMDRREGHFHLLTVRLHGGSIESTSKADRVTQTTEDSISLSSSLPRLAIFRLQVFCANSEYFRLSCIFVIQTDQCVCVWLVGGKRKGVVDCSGI